MDEMSAAEEWTVREQGDADEFCLCIDRGDKWLISFRQNGEMLVEEQRRIAAKISATPDLIKALTELYSSCPVEYDYHGNAIDKDLDAALKSTEAALAKAGVKL